MSLLGTGQSGQKLNETEGSAEGAQATGHGKHTWEHEGAMRMSGRHQGGLEKKKKTGVSSKHGDRLVRSCRQLSLPSQRGDESEEGRDGGGSKAQGTSNKVRWLHYRSIIQHVFDKLPCKGKNKQSCTV